MRLTEQEISAIREQAQHFFGNDVRVYLFGSRTDDSQRGGDIDLLLETRINDVDRIFSLEMQFLAAVKSMIGEQKIDLIVDYPALSERPPVYEHARQTGALL